MNRFIIADASKCIGCRTCEVACVVSHQENQDCASLTAALSGNYSESKVDMVETLNRKLKGWAMFYQFVDFKAKVFSYIDRVVFWKVAA